MNNEKETTGADILGHFHGEKLCFVQKTERIEKPEMVIYNGRIYYDLTPYFNMDSSKTVLQRVPEDTPERRAELKKREEEKYRLTRVWRAK